MFYKKIIIIYSLYLVFFISYLHFFINAATKDFYELNEVVQKDLVFACVLAPIYLFILFISTWSPTVFEKIRLTNNQLLLSKNIQNYIKHSLFFSFFTLSIIMLDGLFIYGLDDLSKIGVSALEGGLLTITLSVVGVVYLLIHQSTKRKSLSFVIASGIVLCLEFNRSNILRNLLLIDISESQGKIATLLRVFSLVSIDLFLLFLIVLLAERTEWIE